jgi:hypothetical protein
MDEAPWLSYSRCVAQPVLASLRSSRSLSLSSSIMHFSLPSTQTLIRNPASTRAAILAIIHSNQDNGERRLREPANDALLVLLPLLIVLSTFLFLLLLFLICILLLRRRRGIALRDNDGPIDMSRDDLVQGEGGVDGVESRWLESVNDSTRRLYLRAKGSFTFFPALAFIRVLNMPRSRLPTAIPARLTEHRHHSIPIFVHPRERSLSVVV